jgi:hypothetical protein
VLALAGAAVVWSLALLTKIHAWLLIPIVAVWTCIKLGPLRAIGAVSAWGVTGLALYFAGWPWLWYDTLARLRGYLGTGVERAVIHVTYFGKVYADRDVPWHYPWFYFLVTVPVGLHVLGGLGVLEAWRRRRQDATPLLWVGSILFLLTLFSTRVPVYDGERLFLVAFPLWAMVIGLGFGTLWERLDGRRWGRIALGLLVAAQGYGLWAYHPFQLSYYNALVGGLRGAERLGLELTYWGDAVDRVLLDHLAEAAEPNDRAALAPTLYPGQGVITTTRAMARRPVVLSDEDAVPTARWVVVSRRTAYWRPELRQRMDRGRRIFVRQRQGVWLSALYEFAARGDR